MIVEKAYSLHPWKIILTHSSISLASLNEKNQPTNEMAKPLQSVDCISSYIIPKNKRSFVSSHFSFGLLTKLVSARFPYSHTATPLFLARAFSPSSNSFNVKCILKSSTYYSVNEFYSYTNFQITYSGEESRQSQVISPSSLALTYVRV